MDPLAVQSEKRHLSDDEGDEQPAPKRQREHSPLEDGQDAISEAETESTGTRPYLWHDHSGWDYPALFWDRLSEIPLVADALLEQARRIGGARPSFPPPSSAPTNCDVLDYDGLAEWAKAGGPDLSDLRGVCCPIERRRSKSQASANHIALSIPTQ